MLDDRMRKGFGALALGSSLLGAPALARPAAPAEPAVAGAASPAVVPAPEAAAPGAAAPEAVSPEAAAPETVAPAAEAPSPTTPASPGEVGVDAGTSAGLRPEPFAAKFEAALRIGVGVPFGKAGKNVLDGSERDLRALTTWRAPVWLEVDYRATPGLSVGAYLQFGVGGTGDSCTSQCTWSDLRTGAELAYHFAPSANASPWLGLGAGYEWLSFKQLSSVELPDGSGDTIPFETTELIGGPELALSGGLDLEVEEALRLGPYATLSVGDYLGDHFKCEPAGLGCPVGSSLNGSGAHAWLSVGLRGSFSP